jgi:hypothetical protein
MNGRAEFHRPAAYVEELILSTLREHCPIFALAPAMGLISYRC